VLFNAGDHVPVVLLVDVVGRALKDAPEQIAATCVNVGVTIGLTVIVKLFEVAGEPAKHGVALDVISQIIISPFASEPVMNVAVFCPNTTTPFFFQTYAGELPPFVGVAVNVTELPEQMPVADAAMETLAVRVGLTVTAVAELVAEHPFEFVTVTVYEPEVLTVIEEVVAPLLHK
jgi:hypothetical protein